MIIMRKEIDVCDKCKKNVAVGKCAICDEDLCGGCGFTIHFYSFDNLHAGISFVPSATDKYFKEGITPILCLTCREIFSENNVKVLNEGDFVYHFVELIKRYRVLREI